MHSSQFKLDNLKTKLNWIVTGTEWNPRESALTPEEAKLILTFLPERAPGVVDKRYKIPYE